MVLEKFNENEIIDIGNIVSLKDGKAVNSVNKCTKTDKHIIGVCTKILPDNINNIEVTTRGTVIVNVVGSVGIGDELTSCEIPGSCRSIKYIQEKRMFNIRSIGKVIYLYKDLSKAKVLLNIE